jgi:hypothetical protein
MRLRLRFLSAWTLGILLLGVVGVCVWALASGWRYRQLESPLANLILILGDDTTYAPNYSERSFGEIQQGMPVSAVLSQLGEPLYRVWTLPVGDNDPKTCCTVVVGGSGSQVIRTILSGMNAGTDVNSIVARYGRPTQERWVYADCGAPTSENRSYGRREVVVENGSVVRTWHEVNID